MEVTVKELDKDIADQLNAVFPKKNCFIKVIPGNVILPRQYAKLAHAIRNFKTYSDDIWLFSYPRTGSTWAQEMIWLLGNKLDYDGAKQMQQIRSPLIELSTLFSEDHNDWIINSLGNTFDLASGMARPRFMRSHMPWPLLPKELDITKPKIIYTARNPKDLCVSYYHYCKLLHGFYGNLDDFIELFLNGNAPVGLYWDHILPFWKRSTDSNVLFLKYEDMKRDLPSVIRKCAKFLEVDYHLADEDLNRICQHLKFDTMQKNTTLNLEPLLNQIDMNGNCSDMVKTKESTELNHKGKFIRKGEIGDWKNYLSDEMSQRFDEWIVKHTKGSGLSFEYE